MKNNYLYALNSKGINNLNYILEDGRFYKNDNDIEYDGAISLDDNKISLIYTKRNHEEKYLILDNFDDNTLIEKVSLGDDRDYLEMYKEFKVSETGFRQKQYLYDCLYQLEKNTLNNEYNEKIETLKGYIHGKVEDVNRKRFRFRKRVRTKN